MVGLCKYRKGEQISRKRETMCKGRDLKEQCVVGTTEWFLAGCNCSRRGQLMRHNRGSFVPDKVWEALDRFKQRAAIISAVDPVLLAVSQVDWKGTGTEPRTASEESICSILNKRRRKPEGGSGMRERSKGV